MTIPPKLRRLYSEGRIIPFVGAGVSMSVSWTNIDGAVVRGPSWSQVVERAASILGFEDVSLLRARGTDLQILEYLKLTHELGGLRTWMQQALSAPEAAIKGSPIHMALAALDRCWIYYTTNFDDWLERGINLAGPRTAVATTSEFKTNFDRNRVEVVKFHGDFLTPEKMVLTETDYQSRLRLLTDMDHRFLGDTLGRSILFMGYSFKDTNVSYIFHLLKTLRGKLDQGASPRGFIVLNRPSNFERRLFEDRDIEVVDTDNEDQSAGVVSVLNELTR